MGEAKRRGSQEQRTEEAKQQKAVTIEELRRMHNIPEEAEFDGFVVWLKNRDEFLVRVNEQTGRADRMYGKDVTMATRFNSFEEAEPHAKASKYPAIVAVAFDLDQRVFIVG